MANGFLHGVEVIDVDAGARPIQGVSASVIGLLGWSYHGDNGQAPVLITSPSRAEELYGEFGTLTAAVRAIFAQGGARVVAVNALEKSQHKTDVAAADKTFAAVANGDNFDLGDEHVVNGTVVITNQAGTTTYDEGDDYTVNYDMGIVTRNAAGAIGVAETVKAAYSWYEIANLTSAEFLEAADKFLEAESATGANPRILIAPHWTGKVTRANPNAPPSGAPITSGLVALAEKMRAIIVADGPNTTNAEAIAYRKLLSSRRVYVVDPGVKISDGAGGTADAPASAYVAGLIAKNDRERGYWTSPSNRELLGIVGIPRAVGFVLGDPNASANLLNEDEVATIITYDGWRLWGNRTASNDAKWAFLSVVRTADIINESLLRAHLWAVDRNLTKTYEEDVVESVNDFLRRLIAQGAILSGRCWADPARNTAAEREAGRVYFDFEFDPPSPAERITFRSQVVSGEVA